MPTVDYLPVATGGSANVDSQANFLGSGYQTNGFAVGIAEPFQANKIWRQSSMMSAALANFISTTLGINVLDDGNLPTLITNLTNAIQSAGASVNITPVTANASSSTVQGLMSGTIIPANSMNILGKTIRFIGSGSLTPVNTTEKITLGINWQSSFGLTVPFCYFVPSTTTQMGWQLEVNVTNVGIDTGSGSRGGLLVNGNGNVSAQLGTGLGGQSLEFIFQNLVVGAHWTEAILPGFNATFGTASASNTITQYMMLQRLLA
jgi:hypothetical protein